MQKKAIAIFGGSFNPPLNSHSDLAKEVINNFKEVEKIIFVPVSTKYNKQNLVEDKHRYNMLKLICEKEENFEVSDIELKSSNLRYTIETLNLLQAQHVDYNIYFIMGTDNLKELDTWKEAEDILKNYKIIVLQREEDVFLDIVNNSKLLKENKESLINARGIDKIHLSSTMIRNKIKNKENVEEFIDKDVLNYIRNNELYI